MEGETISATAAPCISIILPTFERAHLLPRSLRSALAQTFTDWELIVIDDGQSRRWRRP